MGTFWECNVSRCRDVTWLWFSPRHHCQLSNDAWISTTRTNDSSWCPLRRAFNTTLGALQTKTLKPKPKTKMLAKRFRLLRFYKHGISNNFTNQSTMLVITWMFCFTTRHPMSPSNVSVSVQPNCFWIPYKRKCFWKRVFSARVVRKTFSNESLSRCDRFCQIFVQIGAIPANFDRFKLSGW